MIALFTSNTKGGIIQFTMQLLKTLNEIGVSTIAFVPDNAQYTMNEEWKDKIFSYTKIRSVNYKNSGVKAIADKITSTGADVFWCMDDSILAMQAALLLKNITIYCTIHDAIPHPSMHETFKDKIQRTVTNLYRKKVRGCAERIFVLSTEVKNLVIKNQAYLKDKLFMLPLGAHIPDVELQKPSDLTAEAKRFYLFFGRIDKYKGIENLLRAYQCVSENNLPLVIAGGGELSSEEKELYSQSKNVMLLNRFISDSEMLWMLKNALCVVLPYIEASQSGVLPIAYYYGVPVIVSDVPGLTQFVENGTTGIVASDVKALAEAMDITNRGVLGDMGNNAKKYYEDNLDWKTNLKKIFVQE